MRTTDLVAKYPLISDQVSKEQVKVILDEIDRILDYGHSGAIVEFGCYIGTTSLFICRLLTIRHDSRAFHVYDSFEGLPQKVDQDQSPAGTQFQIGELQIAKKQLVHEFQKAGLALPVIHKSWFGDLQPADVPDRIAFAFLDGDFYESIRDSLGLVVPRMVSDGTIIIDDYAREALPGVAKAVHDFAPQLEAKIQVHHNLAIIHL